MKAAREAGADPMDIALADFLAQGKVGGASRQTECDH